MFLYYALLTILEIQFYVLEVSWLPEQERTSQLFNSIYPLHFISADIQVSPDVSVLFKTGVFVCVLTNMFTLALSFAQFPILHTLIWSYFFFSLRRTYFLCCRSSSDIIFQLKTTLLT